MERKSPALRSFQAALEEVRKKEDERQDIERLGLVLEDAPAPPSPQHPPEAEAERGALVQEKSDGK